MEYSVGQTGKVIAARLFEGEDVTKGDKMIHAWSVEDGRRYIEKIMLSSSIL